MHKNTKSLPGMDSVLCDFDFIINCCAKFQPWIMCIAKCCSISLEVNGIYLCNNPPNSMPSKIKLDLHICKSTQLLYTWTILISLLLILWNEHLVPISRMGKFIQIILFNKLNIRNQIFNWKLVILSCTTNSFTLFF